MATLRKMYVPVKDQNACRIKTNEEMKVMYGKPNNVTIKKVQRLEWAGHLVRMYDDSLKRKVFLKKMDGEEKQKTKIKVLRLY